MSRKKDLYDMATAGTININNVKIDNLLRNKLKILRRRVKNASIFGANFEEFPGVIKDSCMYPLIHCRVVK